MLYHLYDRVPHASNASCRQCSSTVQYLPLEVEVVLVEWAGDLEDALPAADDALGQDQGPLMRAHVLGRVPFLFKKKKHQKSSFNGVEEEWRRGNWPAPVRTSFGIVAEQRGSTLRTCQNMRVALDGRTLFHTDLKSVPLSCQILLKDRSAIATPTVKSEEKNPDSFNL